MSEIDSSSETNSPDSLAPFAVAKHSSAPRKTSIQPAAPPRGRRPSRAAAARPSKRRGTPSPPPHKGQPPSPASFYASALQDIPPRTNGPCRAYAKRSAPPAPSSRDPRAPPPTSTPPSKASGKASRVRPTPYSRPEQTPNPSGSGLRLASRSRKPSASLGRAPDSEAASTPPPPHSAKRQHSALPSGTPCLVSLSRQNSASMSPLAAQSLSLSAHPAPAGVICSVYPLRRRELCDYLAIIAELALSYGGSHFYTYHKLFSAKCAIRLAQWNQRAYWGALDTELHSRVFTGCRNISCAVCHSSPHPPIHPPTTACPFIIPSIPPCPEPSQPMPTSYVPHSSKALLSTSTCLRSSSPPSSQICMSFNASRCTRQRCRFMHLCSYCGGVHAHLICPVHKAANKKSKPYLSTPVNISHLSAELTHHPDHNFTNYILSGLTHGFHPGVEILPSRSLICPNLQSALAEPEILASPPGSSQAKKRLIIDLSFPHNSPFPSINSLILLEEFSLDYHDIDQAIALIKDAGRSAWLAKLDITSTFKVMPIHPDFWHLFSIRWRNKFYFAVRLMFGCRSSPKIFEMLSEAICWILSNNHAIPYLIHLLDDFLIISPCDSIPAAHLLAAQKVFSHLGIPLALDKTSGPCTSIEFLGINLDSQKSQASLPKEKIDRTTLVASTLIDTSSCSKRELLSVLSHLNFAMRIIPQGRPFVSHLFSLASCAHALEDRISLTESCRNELSLWVSFLSQWNGLSFFYNNLISSPIDIQLFTDAAPSVSFGGFYQGRWFASTWPPQLLDLPQQQTSSALFELYPLVVAALLWEIQTAGTRGGTTPNPSTSLFATDIPIDHPPSALREASLSSILQAVSPRTLQSYLTAWKSFKEFHSIHKLMFPDFSLLATTSFISHLNLAISSNFNPSIHPTISDLQLLDHETISFFIKQSKTDQSMKGHLIYIFNLQSPIFPYQTLLAFLQLRKSQTQLPSDPLFTDDFNRPNRRSNYSSTKGISQHQIQALSRWSSEAFKNYIRTDHSHIKEAHCTLISHPPSLGFRRSLALTPTLPQQCQPLSPIFYILPLPQQSPLRQEPSLYFLTAAAVLAPTGAFPKFTAAAASASQESFLFSPLPLQKPPLYFHTAAVVSTPAGVSLYFHTAAVVSAPAGALSLFFTQHKLSLYFHTAAVVSAPAGAFSVFPPCRSNGLSRRSLSSISPLPQQCLPHRSFFSISPLPQYCLLPQEPSLCFHTVAVVLFPQEPFLYLLTAAAVSTPAEPFFSTSSPPQQCPLPQEPFSLPPHCRSSVRSRRSLFLYLLTAAAVIAS
ncbi:Pro-Pol polyprotein [Labeo rohita]|uniref:ribonuclease H n=1 Tax=Labeo rohita TaxID=84645 RepID=A0ABQ8L636_LABRO|nr:Pro-Pol polyprotein [Labeo rohita]